MSVISDVQADVNMREITFSLTPEQLEQGCERAYQRQKKDIMIKGFRKGKVPRKMVEKLYGEEVFFEEAVNSLLPGELDSILSELNIEIVDRPSVEMVSCTKAEGAVCKATLITKPEVKISEYKGIHAPMKVREITDEDVDAQVETLRQRQARMVDVDDRAAQDGDEVKINFEGFMDGEAFEGGKGEDFALRLGSGQFIQGFEDQIVGKSIGEKFDVNVTFPEDYGDDRYAGKDAVFKTELLSISAQELPDVDDEFAKDISEFDTLEEMREDLRAQLAKTAEQQAQTAFENIVFDKIVDNTEAIIPKVMFDRRIDQQVHEFEHRLTQQYSDLSLEEYLQLTGMTMEQLRDEYEPQAKKEVTLRLALEKIADLEDIQVSDEELEENLTQMAADMQVPVEAVRARLPIEDYRTDLRVSKVAEFVKSNAVVDNDLLEETEETEAEEPEGTAADTTAETEEPAADTAAETEAAEEETL